MENNEINPGSDTADIAVETDTNAAGPNPSGLCGCGCGQPTKLSKKTNKSWGHVQGTPQRFKVGHNCRKTQWIIDPDTGCWLWQLFKIHDGYAWTRGHVAHRVVYERLVGPIPPGIKLHHTCKVRHCVNPQHMRLVTPAEHRKHHQIDDAKVVEIRGRLESIVADHNVKPSEIRSVLAQMIKKAA